MQGKNKYVVTWITGADGATREEEYESVSVNITPSGAIFFNPMPERIERVQLSATPSNEQEQPIEVIGIVTGFISLKRV